MASSTSKPLPNWLELPSDIMANILHRVGVVDISENAQKVCTTWHKICKDHPAMWRVIHMNAFLYLNEMSRLRLEKICKLAVNRSQGQLVDFTVVGFDNDEILRCVADRSSQLRRLEIANCLFNSWNEALKKFPLLEELNFYATNISKEAIETAGHYCPMLKTLRVNQKAFGFLAGGEDVDDESIMMDDEFAKAIGQNLVDLRHLEFIGSSMSNVGLQMILDGCCRLQSLDLRDCWHIDLNKDRLKRCLEQIKHLKLPYDSLEDCPYLVQFSGVIAYDVSAEPWQVLDDCDPLFEDHDEYADTTEPWQYWDEYHPVFEDHDEHHPVFEDYDYDAYVDYCLEEAAFAASMNRR